MKIKPMKAPSEPITDEQLSELIYPVAGSPKIDGFRCLIDEQIPKTSSMKPFMNKFVQKELSGYKELEGFDGEMIVGKLNDPNIFELSSGPLRRFEGEPDFTLWVFNCTLNPKCSYEQRWLDLIAEGKPDTIHPRIRILPQRLLYSPEEILAYEEVQLSRGFEGIMLQSLHAPWKNGRATFKEKYVFKRKPFVDEEAIIIDFVEQLENTNEQVTNELGRSKRSSHQAGMIPKGTLGKFLVKNKRWGEFAVGLGKLTQLEALKVWDNREVYLGQIITFRYQEHGSQDKPRQPRFRRFRPDWDITEEV